MLTRHSFDGEYVHVLAEHGGSDVDLSLQLFNDDRSDLDEALRNLIESDQWISVELHFDLNSITDDLIGLYQTGENAIGTEHRYIFNAYLQSLEKQISKLKQLTFE